MDRRLRLLADMAVVVVACIVVLVVVLYLADALTGEPVPLRGEVVEKEFTRPDGVSVSVWIYTVKTEEGYLVVKVPPKDYTGVNKGDQVELRCIRGGVTGNLRCKIQ